MNITFVAAPEVGEQGVTTLAGEKCLPCNTVTKALEDGADALGCNRVWLVWVRGSLPIHCIHRCGWRCCFRRRARHNIRCFSSLYMIEEGL